MTLKTLDAIRQAVEKRPGELEAARKDGRKVVGWIGYTIPEEIIHALGLIPVRIGRGGDDRLVEIGARYISTQNCVFVRASAGLFAENKDPFVKNTDAIVVDNTCMQIYRLGEIIRHYFKKKTLFIGVPRNFNTPAGQEYYLREVEAYTYRLEELSGTTINSSSLKVSVELYNNIRNAIKDLYNYSQTRICSEPGWREVFAVVQAGYYLDRNQYLVLLRQLLREIEETRSTPLSTKSSPEDIRILISGSVIAPGDTKLIDIIGQVHGKVVRDDLWSGLNPYLMENIHDPSIAGIAGAYINRVPHHSLPVLDADTDPRYHNLMRAIRDSSADGVIFHTLRYCDSNTFKALELRDRLKKNGIPMLEIHTEYAGSDTEAIRTRSEAFVELLKFRETEEVKI